MLSAPSLNRMRRALERTMVDTAVILRATETNDAGVVSRQWEAVASLPCRINTLGTPVTAGQGGGEKGEFAGRVSDETTHVLTVPAYTDVEEEDRVVVDSVVYDILAVRKRGAWELSRRLELKENAPETAAFGEGLYDLGAYG